MVIALYGSYHVAHGQQHLVLLGMMLLVHGNLSSLSPRGTLTKPVNDNWMKIQMATLVCVGVGGMVAHCRCLWSNLHRTASDTRLHAVKIKDRRSRLLGAKFAL